MEILRLESISKNFGGVAAVSEFSLTQEDNTITAIIGPNMDMATSATDAAEIKKSPP